MKNDVFLTGFGWFTRPRPKAMRSLSLNGNAKNVLCGLFFTVLSLLLAGVSFGATYYVSPSGSGTTCSSAAPCAASYAMTKAVAGDTWIFQSGTYNIGNQSSTDYRLPILNPAHSGTSGNPITFQSQTPGGAVLNAGTGYGSPQTAVAIGAEGNSYIVWNGFKLTDTGSSYVEAYISTSASYITIENCEFDNTYNASNNGNNVNGIKIESASYTTIQNNYIHGYNDPSGDHNTSGLWTESSSNTLVTGNTFSNNSENIYPKYESTNDTYTLNFLGAITSQGLGNNNANFFIQDYSGAVTNMAIYQNIIIGGTSGINADYSQTAGNTGNTFYNNTFYGQTGSSSPEAALAVTGNETSSWSAWNNIILATSGAYYITWEYASMAPVLLDYNDYYSTSGAPEWGSQLYGSSFTTTSLSSWLSKTGFDQHSTGNNPNFTNGSGSFSLPTDFKRTSYPANGRGGSYASVMGAYITGNETIGTSTSSAKVPLPPVLQVQ